MKKINSLIVLLLFCSFLSGCGYTTKSTLAGHLQTIHVELFVNEIDYTAESSRKLYIPLLEVDARNAIVDRFLFDGNLRTADAGQGDLVLSGVLKGYDRGVLRFTDDDDIEEYRIHIIVSMTMYDTQEEKVIWTESSFVGEATYFLIGPLAKSEEVAVDEAIEDLARRIVERTIENW